MRTVGGIKALMIKAKTAHDHGFLPRNSIRNLPDSEIWVRQDMPSTASMLWRPMLWRAFMQTRAVLIEKECIWAIKLQKEADGIRYAGMNR